MLSTQFTRLHSSTPSFTGRHNSRVESQQAIHNPLVDTFISRINKSTPRLTFGMAPQRFIALRPVGERKLTLVSELNPLGYLPIADLSNPGQMETELQNKGLSTLRIRASDCKEPGDILVAYHDETLRDLIKGPYSARFRRDLVNNGPAYFTKTVASYGAVELDRYAKIFSDFKNKSVNEQLDYLKRVGTHKPIGELSCLFIRAALGEDGEQQMIRELEAKGIKTLLRRSAVAHIDNDGALFAYDENALKNLLDKPDNQAILHQNNWPTHPEGFVRAISSSRPVKPGSPLWRLIGKAYADSANANLYL